MSVGIERQARCLALLRLIWIFFKKPLTLWF
jgi:hypothetical protein